MSIKFPSVKDVAQSLREHKRGMVGGEEWDVRLQVTEEGDWIVRTGDASYDLDHRGFWGAGSLTPSTNCRELAKDLLEQAKDHAAQCM